MYISEKVRDRTGLTMNEGSSQKKSAILCSRYVSQQRVRFKYVKESHSGDERKMQFLILLLKRFQSHSYLECRQNGEILLICRGCSYFFFYFFLHKSSPEWHIPTYYKLVIFRGKTQLNIFGQVGRRCWWRQCSKHFHQKSHSQAWSSVWSFYELSCFIFGVWK